MDHGKLKIVDGDTIVINNQKIRLWGIDAPEMKQICKNKFKSIIIVEEKKILERADFEKLQAKGKCKIEPNNEVCALQKKDRYKRILGIVPSNVLSMESMIIH